jgi:hypothetical protein
MRRGKLPNLSFAGFIVAGGAEGTLEIASLRWQ